MKTYSSGMYVRLAFAVAINVDPTLLIIDEILAVGDVDFQQQCLEKFVEFRNEGRTIVLVTHDLESVRTCAIGRSGSTTASCVAPATRVRSSTGTRSRCQARRDRVAALGSYREGSGEIQFTDITMSVGGEPSVRVRTGDDVDIDLVFATGTTWRARRCQSR